MFFLAAQTWLLTDGFSVCLSAELTAWHRYWIRTFSNRAYLSYVKWAERHPSLLSVFSFFLSTLFIASNDCEYKGAPLTFVPFTKYMKGRDSPWVRHQPHTMSGVEPLTLWQRTGSDILKVSWCYYLLKTAYFCAGYSPRCCWAAVMLFGNCISSQIVLVDLCSVLTSPCQVNRLWSSITAGVLLHFLLLSIFFFNRVSGRGRAVDTASLQS